MAVNTKSFVSWGVFGGSSATETVNRFASWGLWSKVVAAVSGGVGYMFNAIVLFIMDNAKL